MHLNLYKRQLFYTLKVKKQTNNTTFYLLKAVISTMKKCNLHTKQEGKKVLIAPTSPENDVKGKTKSRFLRQKPYFSA
ncbi:hypothetical protein EJ73_01306 [Hoylesella shahii DSM 15611 = JCM 12083]|jgi:hypothetical protein|uniref:Uncharacterized protein n=1 Tax=Hoylesella shahii DSM 15611 = JCM 12083 TaxID=1122991 RepID=A0A318HZ29_9BACT|nr:hypothetical protein EJ73_01306 [Hoylesella shahii DSM 15611 = JCM 12083]